MSSEQRALFNPDRLDLARRRRGLTRRKLCESVGIAPKSLVRYFNDEREPGTEIVGRLAKTLRFPAKFFYGPTPDEASQEGPSFRALSRLTARQRDRAVAAGTLGMCLSDWIDQRFGLPEPSIPQYEYNDPETTAMEVRAQWGLGERPVRNITHLLELHGARVFSLSEDTKNLDAYSFWRGETPFIFLDTGKSAERSRMDAAHELGHLVLHSRGGPQNNRQAEQEAQQFAAAFLMPRGSVLGRVRPGSTVQQIIEAKHYWIVSVANLTYRLRQLGLLTSYQYTQAFIEIGQRDYRTREPEPALRERSQVLEKVFGRLRDRGISVAQVADELAIYPEELGSLLFGLVRFPVSVRGERG